MRQTHYKAIGQIAPNGRIILHGALETLNKRPSRIEAHGFVIFRLSGKSSLVIRSSLCASPLGRIYAVRRCRTPLGVQSPRRVRNFPLGNFLALERLMLFGLLLCIYYSILFYRPNLKKRISFLFFVGFLFLSFSRLLFFRLCYFSEKNCQFVGILLYPIVYYFKMLLFCTRFFYQLYVHH